MYLRPYLIRKYIPYEKKSPFWKIRWPSLKKIFKNYGQQSMCELILSWCLSEIFMLVSLFAQFAQITLISPTNVPVPLGKHRPIRTSYLVWRRAPLHRTIFRFNSEKKMAAPISMLTSSTIDGCDFYNRLQLFGHT